MSKNIKLNFNIYPLVVGQEEKYTFSGWEVEGGTIQLKADYLADVYTGADITWQSENPKIAVVDENGLVRAMTTGVTDVTATLPDGSLDTCRIQVIDNWGRLTADKVTLNTPNLLLNKLEGAQLYPQIFPADYFENGMLDNNFIWESSNPDIVVVNHLGRLWGKECGTATITGISMDVGRTVSCQVEVIKKPKEIEYADPLEDMEGGNFTVNYGETKTLALPEDVAHQEVWWCSSNESIAEVDQTGTVRFHKEGKVTIYATFIRGGHRVSYQVEGKNFPKSKITKIVLNTEHIHIAAGERTSIYAAVFPATVLEKQLRWNVSDSKVAHILKQHINLSGLDEIVVEALTEGQVTITGACDDMEVTCKLTVSAEKILPTKVILPKEITIEREQVMELCPVLEENVTERELIWKTENPDIVTVDKDGVLKGYINGETVITCSSKASGEILAKTIVKVTGDCPSLSNLHIPAETITHKSVCLLWNRKSLLDTEAFSCYAVYDNEKLITKTTALGYTVKNLEPDTPHVFRVVSLNDKDEEIYAQTVEATTKSAPTAILNVTKEPYNAVGNGLAIDTDRIQKAIDDCPENGVVLLPKGYIFHSGALFLKDNMTFQVDGILYGSYDPKDYPPIVCRWEGYRKMRLTKENQAKTVPVFDENVYSHSSLINIGVYDEGEAGKLSPLHTFNVNICGEGMINGNGFSLSYNQGPCWYTLMKGLPVPQSPMRDQNIRGRVIAFYNTKGAYVSDVTVAYGPAWTIHPVFSKDITFDNVKVITMGNGRTGVKEGMLILNGDGIDPDSSTHINIFDCYFTVGDDAVAIKSGRNRQGNELAKPSAYIRVTDSRCVDAKCSFCIGSEQAGGAHDILFQNLYVENLKNFGLWIKSAPCRGGLVENVLWKDCILKDTGAPLQIEYRHGGDEDPSLVLPETRRITYENLYIEGESKFGIRLIGEPESPIHDVTFRGVAFNNFSAKKDKHFYMENCHSIEFIDADLPEGFEWETP